MGMITPADKSMLCTNSGIVPNSQSQTSWTPTFDVAAANATENMENMTAMASGAKSVSSGTPSSSARTPLSPRSPNVVATDLSFNSEKAGHTPGTSLSFGSRKKRKNPNAERQKGGTATKSQSATRETVPTTSRIELADAAGSPVTPAGPGPQPVPTTTKLEMSPEATHVAFDGDGDGGDLAILSPDPAGARAPANTPAAATMNDGHGHGPVIAGPAAALVHSHSPTASQEDVVEEVKSWFASVHSKLDLALSAISPGGHLRATTPARPPPSEKTPAEGGEEGAVESSPDALTASAQSPATLMGATGAVARLIEEALAAPDAPVFQPATSPVSAWMARPRALVEALAEPLTPSPAGVKTLNPSTSSPASLLAPLPEDCVTPIADIVDDRPGFTAAEALVADVSRPDVLRVVATLSCAGLVSTFPVAVTMCALSIIVGALTSAFTRLFVPPPVEPIVAVVKGSFMIFPPFLARFVAMTETYLINVGAAMRSVPFDAAAAAEAAEEAERLAAIGRVSLTSEGLAILAVLLFSFASVAGAALLAMYPEGDVLRGVRVAFIEAREMSSPAASAPSPAASGDVSWIADADETEECATSTASPAGASSGKTPRGAFMEQVENVSSKLGAIKRMIFADAGDEEVKCTAVVDELKLKLEARNRVARGMDAFPWMSYPPAKSPAAAEVW